MLQLTWRLCHIPIAFLRQLLCLDTQMYKVASEQTVPAVGHDLVDMSPLRIYAPLNFTAPPVTHFLYSPVLCMTALH